MSANESGELLQHADEASDACETYVCASAAAYRRLAGRLPGPDDVVIEIGASTGKATKRLAARAGRVIAVEHSDEMLELARAALEGADNVTLLKADAWDLGPVLNETSRADCVFVDIAGSAPPWSTLRLAERYRTQFRPRCLVIRNTRLAGFVSGGRFCVGAVGRGGGCGGQECPPARGEVCG
ncbi:MAG: methyltransferase domain-containing protein [Armatimonadota bacterium]